MIKVRSEKTQQGTSLYWVADKVGEICPNYNGVKSEHLTTLIQGVAVVRMKSGETILRAGDSIVLPINTPYEVEVLELKDGLVVMRCDYAKENEHEVKHLDSEQYRSFTTLKASVISVDKK